ncbi:MAG: aminotransferase class I/II-fold pyridoxal phosphate-dependent enzyme [Candidatus Hydrogenedentes bacterium]|nr:aminotransferase class I/II-fold pyridoxal phosphate-dependent enzyme [Candidatus Hydrogenedentota bacterium]
MIPRRRAHMYAGEAEELAAWLRSGPPGAEEAVAELERAIARYVGMPDAAAVSSGRQGMRLILEHAGVGPGDEVVIPAYTLAELIPLIQQCGATVVAADIDPATLNVTPAAVQARITPRTKAILVLHAFGAPADARAIAAMTAPRGIPVIEDCAHSLGATDNGLQTGGAGYAGFFSLEITKPVNSYGGGIAVSRDFSLTGHVRRGVAGAVIDPGHVPRKLRIIRLERILFSTGLAFPLLFLLANPASRALMHRLYRLWQHATPPLLRYAPVQARVALKKLATLDERIAVRNQRAALLASLLHPDIRVQRVRAGCTSAWYFFVALLPCPAAAVRRGLLLRGIDAAVEHEIADDCAAWLGQHDCPNARDVFTRAIALPMFDGIDERTIERVARTLNKLLA